jgi:hypothetical protein
MDNYLLTNLNSYVYNLKRDWDFVLVVSGSGLLRVGKSMLAQQIGGYLAEQLGTPFTLDNVMFNAKDLMEKAHKFPKNSVIIYDEARENLDNKKTLEASSKLLMDYFAECGMYNHIYILVLPNFFDLNKGMAVTRADGLINVDRIQEQVTDPVLGKVVSFKRGFFEFYNRKGKKTMFILGKKNFEDYSVGDKCRAFYGSFNNHWVMDKFEYENKKLEFLRRDREKPAKPMSKSGTRWKKQRDTLFRLMIERNYMTQEELVKQMQDRGIDIDQTSISKVINNESTLEN